MQRYCYLPLCGVVFGAGFTKRLPHTMTNLCVQLSGAQTRKSLDYYPHFASNPDPIPHRLSDVMPIPESELKNETTPVILELWRRQCRLSNSMGGHYFFPIYEEFRRRTNSHPTFVIPFHKDGRYFPVTLRISPHSDTFLFHMDQTKKISKMVVSYYTDLANTNDIVLFKGDFYGDMLTYKDGVSLMQTSALFYLQDEWYEKYVIPFSYDKLDFKAMANSMHTLNRIPASRKR
jgi:hypothetical protein